MDTGCVNLTCTNQLKKNEVILSPTDVPKRLSWSPFPITPKTAAQKLTIAKNCCRFRSLRRLNDTPMLCSVRQEYNEDEGWGETYVKITNPQVIIDIPEQRPVTRRNAILSSGTRELPGMLLGGSRIVWSSRASVLHFIYLYDRTLREWVLDPLGRSWYTSRR